MNKAVLNRQIQVLENALIELRKLHNRTIDDINKYVKCEECKKVQIEYAKKRRKQFNRLSASLLGIFPQVDYSKAPYNLFDKESE